MADAQTQGRNRLALRAGVWYTISNIATKAILVLTTPIFTRVMTLSDYGVAANFTAWYSLLITFCTLNLTYSIGRAKLDFPGRLDAYVGTMQVVAMLCSLLLAGLGIVFRQPVARLLDLPPKLVPLLALYLLFAPTTALYQAKYKYQYRYRENLFITGYTAVASVGVSLMLVFAMPQERYLGRVLGAVLPAVALGGVFWVQAARRGRLALERTFVRYGLMISLPLILNSLSLNILAQSDRVVITKVWGSEATAVYTLAYQYAILISLVLDSIGQAWLPWFHDAYAAGDHLPIRQNLKPLILLGCYVGAACIAIAPEAMHLLGGAGYREGRWAVAPIVLGLVCKFIYGNYEHIELHLKKTRYIAMGTVLATAINLALNLLFVPRFGFVAAGYTTFFSYFVLMSVHYGITRHGLHVNVYDHRFMYLTILLETLLAMLLLWLDPYPLARFAVLGLMTLAAIWRSRSLITALWRRKRSAGRA
ncbi:MAG: lipopolysaccharide biosynthesis protein [Candidatus Limiplasma sp.]|nr:lipopolysaccharide biosynthesis protein [Candidatus Limiplasma sp.]MEA5146753.1 lipopolysaccharide biosynthesis protein [Candidatus Limiplasma sp.]